MTPAAARVSLHLVFARDWEATYVALLRNQSLIVIGSKDRWWPTREQRLAQQLTAHGHSVAVIKVK